MYILKGHVPYVKKVAAAEPRPTTIEEDIRAGFTIQRLMEKHRMNYDQVKGRMRRIRETGVLV